MYKESLKTSIATLFTMAKIRKQLKCPTIGQYINKLWNIQKMESYLESKLETTGTVTWINLEIIILGKKAGHTNYILND